MRGAEWILAGRKPCTGWAEGWLQRIREKGEIFEVVKRQRNRQKVTRMAESCRFMNEIPPRVLRDYPVET
jgi:hypothetical protein